MRFVITVLRPMVWWLCRLWFKVEFHGVENIPPGGACVITPNHITYADPIWVAIPVLRRIYFMAWDKPFDIPVLGFLMRAFGAFPVRLEVADTAAHREAGETLKAGRALVIFPEGGRSKTGELMPFKMGAFRLALTYGAPIVPVTIKGAYEIWPVGRWLPRPGKLIITYHPPIEVERATEDMGKTELKEQARRLARLTHDRVAGGLDSRPVPEGENNALSVHP